MYKITKSKFLNLFVALTMVLGLVTIPTKAVNATIATYVVISEVYGGGGNSGATLKNDFIELYNPTANDINLDGWKFEYASKTGTFNQSTELSGIIKAGGYYLIQQGAGAGESEELDTPDATGNISMSGSECKVRLVDNNGNIIDLVGIGLAANESETSPTDKMSNTTSVQRKDNNGEAIGETNGWDTNNNKDDFYLGTPTPRNSSYNNGGSETPDPGPEENDIISIEEARKATESVKVKGTIIFKEVSGSYYNYALQDGSAGIALRGKDELELGDEVIVEGQPAEYKGLIQIQYTNIEKRASNVSLPEPKEVKITDIINNDGGEKYESQRVKFIDVTIGDINTSSNTVITDNEGNTINLYKIPELDQISKDDKVDVIGVCSQFTSYQIRVARASEITKSQVSGETEEDRNGPTLTLVTPGNLVTTNNKVTIKVSYKDESEIKKDSLSFLLDDINVSEKAEIGDKYITYMPEEELTVGDHKISLSLSDINGNNSVLEAVITVKEKVNVNGLNVYFGQLHSHTNISDGAGSIEDAYDYAKNKSGVDFLAVTDHSNSLDNDKEASMEDGSMSPEWVNAHNVAEKYTDENFLGVYAYEMTWSNGIGHINTFNTPGFESRNKSGLTNNDSNALQNYYNKLKEFPASLSQLNHPGKTFGDFNDFSLYDEQIDSLVTMIEVGNGEGAIRGSGYFPSYDYYTRALDKGWHVAPTNNQDNHKGKWGNANTARTVILAEDLNEENLYDALRNMRTYSTEDENLSIVYTLNDEIMGSIIDKPDTVNIKVDVKDEDNENIGKVSVLVNGGAVIDSKTLNSNEGTIEFDLPADYSYYYIRIDQEDKDIAVTAPVWLGEVEKAGLSTTEASTTMPIKGEEFIIETSLYNNEDFPLTIDSIEYSIDGEVINSTSEKITINSLSTGSYSFKYTPNASGSFNIDVKAKGTLNGVEKTYTDVLKITVSDPSVISKVVIDATHFNDYVGGYYANNMGNFTAIANSEDVAVNIETNKITNELLKDVQLLIITAPAKKAGTANGISYEPQSFSDEFIKVVKNYADNGGNIIVTGLADYQDGTGEYASSTQINKLLEALDVTTRINNDEVVDDDNNAGQSYRLRFKNINTNSEFTNGVVAEQEYSFYSGCSVSLNEKSVKEGKATWLVKGFDTTYSFDSNKNTTGVSVPKGEVIALATEKLSGGGNVFVGGTVFMSDFEVQASLDNYGDLQYSNYNIVLNILESAKKEVAVTPIKDVRSAEMGEVFCIEGYVTAGTQEGNAFFDTIYVQDKTAGINIFPVAGIDLNLGQKVRIIGSVSSYEGEKQINLNSIEVLEEENKIIEPTKLTTKEATLEVNKGLLVSVTGIVKSIGADNSGYMIVNDGSGDVRVFLNGYVGSSDNSIETGKFNSNIKVGDTVTAIGLASTDTEGDRIRVRDSKEVILEKSTETTITILHTNDSHGRVKADSSVIGIDTISAIKKSISNSLLVDAGDTLHGLPFATLNKGADIVNLMKLSGYDLMTPGNHDFNYGYERLLELAALAEEGENGFEIISANVLKDNESLLKSNSIKEIDGIKVGFFGLTTPETAYKTNPNNVIGIEFFDPIESAKKQVASLKAQGADIVIALAHVGTDESSEVQSTMIAEAVEGIDVIIDGHSHTVFENGYEAANNTLIVSTGEYEGNLGKLSLVVDRETKKIKVKTASLINKEEALTYTPESTVTDAIKAIDNEQLEILSEVVGNSLVKLDGERGNVRTKETNLANLITDAMLYETEADIAITNGGGIRSSIDEGEITRGEIISVLPFGNFIVTKYLTGSQIKEVLEHGVRVYPESLGGFTQVGGLKFIFDDTKPAGERVVKITVNGENIDMNKRYLVATNDFLAAGGDEYPCFGDVATENEFRALDEALASYIESLGKVNYEVEGRITIDTLENIEAQENKAAADKVIDLINKLPKEITLNHKDKVKEARASYEALTDIQKELIPSNILKVLEDAEAKIKVLEDNSQTTNPGNGGNNNSSNGNQGSGNGKLPSTGGMNVFYLYLLGSILIGTGALFAVNKKKSNSVNKY